MLMLISKCSQKCENPYGTTEACWFSCLQPLGNNPDLDTALQYLLNTVQTFVYNAIPGTRVRLYIPHEYYDKDSLPANSS